MNRIPPLVVLNHPRAEDRARLRGNPSVKRVKFLRFAERRWPGNQSSVVKGEVLTAVSSLCNQGRSIFVLTAESRP